MSLGDTDELLAIEEWFADQGIPHFIYGYSATEDVWTRAVSFLLLIFVSEIFLTFGEAEGLAQAVLFLIGVVITFASIAAVNLVRGRRLWQRPDQIGADELFLFVAVPPVLALLGGHDSWFDFLVLLSANVLMLAAVYFIVAWGVLHMVWWGLRDMWNHIMQMAVLLARMVPLMLLFSSFIFLNGDIWQVVKDMPVGLFLFITGGIFLLASVFVFVYLKGAVSELKRFTSGAEVLSLLDRTPFAGLDGGVGDSIVTEARLGRRAKLNVRLKLVIGLLTQMVLVSMLIFVFYVGFGALTVRAETVQSWTNLDANQLQDVTMAAFTIGGVEITTTWLHMFTAGLVAAFSGLQFAVSLVTDDDYRQNFRSDSDLELRQALAVRILYLNLLGK